MSEWKEYLNERLEKDSEFKREYDALQPEYEIIRAMYETYLSTGMTQKELAEKTGIAQAEF
jgi:uncharacterized protein involved in exopolysaccharide biosynthesis